jgi:hypothetical protein
MMIKSTQQQVLPLPLAKECPPQVSWIPPRLYKLRDQAKQAREDIIRATVNLQQLKEEFNRINREYIELQTKLFEEVGMIHILPEVIKSNRSTTHKPLANEEEVISSLNTMSNSAKNSLIQELLELKRKEEDLELARANWTIGG